MVSICKSTIAKTANTKFHQRCNLKNRNVFFKDSSQKDIVNAYRLNKLKFFRFDNLKNLHLNAQVAKLIYF